MIDTISYNDSMAALLNEAVAGADSYTRDDIFSLVKDSPGNAALAFCDGKPAAIAAHTARRGDKRGSFTLFVTPKERGKGVGRALAARVLDEMRGLGIQTVYTDFEPDARGLRLCFAKRLGMRPAFRSCLMQYTGGMMECGQMVEPYSDDMYEQFHCVLSNAFHDLRKSLGLEPYVVPQSEMERVRMKDNARDYYVIKQNGRIIGVGCANGGKLDDIAVDNNFRGRGIGRALAAYGVNQSINNGFDGVLLWVVETNREARGLYESMGFTIKRVHQFCTAEL